MSLKETRSTCPYCGVGCGVIIGSDQNQIISVRGDPDHPANRGKLCSKGSSLHLSAKASEVESSRVLMPMIRRDRDAPWVNTNWEEALDHSAQRLSQIVAQSGPDAVGFYISGQLLTEDYYVFNKLAKGLIGTNNIDTNSRLCMSSAVAGYKMTLGADAPPACYEDIDHATCIFIAGSNAAFAHPILFRRIEAAKEANPELKIICVDPRKTDTSQSSDLHLAIQPGTDVCLFNGMLHIMLWEGWTQTDYIKRHTTGFEDLKQSVRDLTPQHVAQVCGISIQDLYQASEWFAKSTATLSLYCQGLNQSSSGTDKNAALVNLHLACAQMGKPGAGPFSLTGQPNAMGGREVGGLANLLSAHRDMANPTHRDEVARLWGVKAVPSQPGKTAIEMFQAAADGEIKALWIACTNPAQSMPDQKTVRRALERCEFVVLQEAFMQTATMRFAHLVLPATTWGEKEGTVTNSERSISRVRKAIQGPGESMDDWRIVVKLARLLERDPVFHHQQTGIGSLFPYESAESIWLEHRDSTRSRDLDITGLTYQKLESAPAQWPYPEGALAGKKRLYEDAQFPTLDGKAHFANVSYKATAEQRESRYPFALNTGRLRDQWHGMSRTGLVSKLFGHVPEPVIELNPQDMDKNGWVNGELLHVTSKRGSILVKAIGSTEIGLTQAFMGMHWGEEFLSGRSNTGEPLAGVNALTTSSFCPHSKQPELKYSAVRIVKAHMGWSMLAATWVESHHAQIIRTQLREFMPLFEFTTCVPFGQDRTGLLFRAAHSEPPPTEWLEKIEKILGLSQSEAIHYEDAKLSLRRRFVISKDLHHHPHPHLKGFLISGKDIASGEAWIQELMQTQSDVQGLSRALLQGKKPILALPSFASSSPSASANALRSSPYICTCVGVQRHEIDQHLELQGQQMGMTWTPLTRLEDLQRSLKCGTECGSCVPQLKRIIDKSTSISKTPQVQN